MSSLLRIRHDFDDIVLNPITNTSVFEDESNPLHWIVYLLGPIHSPFQNGVFILDIHFTEKYPHEAPKVVFRTKIFHRFISKDGKLSPSLLPEEWCPSYTMNWLLSDIERLLREGQMQDYYVMRPAVDQLYREDFEKYSEIAMKWTEWFAMSTRDAILLAEEQEKTENVKTWDMLDSSLLLD